MAAQASFAVSGVTVNLIDLDTTDGVTPSITFNTEYGYAGYTIRHLPGYNDYISGGTNFGAVHNSSQWAIADASVGTRSLSLGVQTLQANVTAELSARSDTLFTLSKNTLAIFSVPYTVSLTKSSKEFLDTSFKFSAGVPGSYFDSDYTFRRGQVSSTLFGEIYTGSSAGEGSLNLLATIYTSTSGTPPIPEPGTYAMLLAGLGVIGWRLRQRNATSV
ncbi:PEP-CTERM sorting domain-containing protein [Duganella ginsengisoli]|uniref:PEP-CTERM sorting domain-containing protein n=2 Tax=Pseudoduganella ginsengisoli TaxID=1462440 RepID=A0A6L6PXX2_9BURK|nr:PEP-CTERM sorting domain-containing protein [Pseudoduganella ginsengisoli]